MKKFQLYTIGQLRKIAEETKELPDDHLIISQVVGSEAGAWNMRADFVDIAPNSNLSVITLSHPSIKDLNDVVKKSDLRVIQNTMIDRLLDIQMHRHSTDYHDYLEELNHQIKQLNNLLNRQNG